MHNSRARERPLMPRRGAMSLIALVPPVASATFPRKRFVRAFTSGFVGLPAGRGRERLSRTPKISCAPFHKASPRKRAHMHGSAARLAATIPDSGVKLAKRCRQLGPLRCASGSSCAGLGDRLHAASAGLASSAHNAAELAAAVYGTGGRRAGATAG
jgi:hypothetical protein